MNNYTLCYRITNLSSVLCYFIHMYMNLICKYCRCNFSFKTLFRFKNIQPHFIHLQSPQLDKEICFTFTSHSSEMPSFSSVLEYFHNGLSLNRSVKILSISFSHAKRFNTLKLFYFNKHYIKVY